MMMNTDERGHFDALTEVSELFSKCVTLWALDSWRRSASGLCFANSAFRGIRAERLCNEHTAQCLNYWRGSGRTLCLLVNFQKPKVEWKRIVRESLPLAGGRARAVIDK
jgi:hypothetical protein